MPPSKSEIPLDIKQIFTNWRQLMTWQADMDPKLIYELRLKTTDLIGRHVMVSAIDNSDAITRRRNDGDTKLSKAEGTFIACSFSSTGLPHFILSELIDIGVSTVVIKPVDTHGEPVVEIALIGQ